MGIGIWMDFTTLKILKGNILACLIKIDTLFYRLYNNFELSEMSGRESYFQKVNFYRCVYRCAALCKYVYNYAVEKDSEILR